VARRSYIGEGTELSLSDRSVLSVSVSSRAEGLAGESYDCSDWVGFVIIAWVQVLAMPGQNLIKCYGQVLGPWFETPINSSHNS